VPPSERELFDGVGEHWQQREIYNYYDLCQDRFSLLDDVPVTGTVPEYRTRRFGGFDVTTLPTPGHTLGSVTYWSTSTAGGSRSAAT
jgi:glyoxylase-like metal-dependent hydrolase (beta-lactamase superfamily II)